MRQLSGNDDGSDQGLSPEGSLIILYHCVLFDCRIRISDNEGQQNLKTRDNTARQKGSL